MKPRPGSTIGVLGDGQLGRMMAMEARRMEYRIVALSPSGTGPAARLADDVVIGDYRDIEAAAELARRCDVVTVETEHIDADILAHLETITIVRPGAAVLRVIQDRRNQRAFLREHGFPQTAFHIVDNEDDLARGVASVGTPCVLKTAHGGYDGKGQVRIDNPDEARGAWESLGHRPCVLEAWVDFVAEVSVVLARSPSGEVRAWPLAENEHRDHVLHLTRMPTRLGDDVQARAIPLASNVVDALGHIGSIAVELFVLPSGHVLVNEIAPRPHNSGHNTFGASTTSQFEQHVRAICGWPLGDPTMLRPSIMINLLGDLWIDGEPPLHDILAIDGVRLHLYGKDEVRPGRKMGHLLVTGVDRDATERAAAAALQLLGLD